MIIPTVEHVSVSARAFRPFEVNAPHVIYAILGGFVVVFSLFSLFIRERLYIGEAVVATVFGILMGPHVANLFSPVNWGSHSDNLESHITLEVTRVVIALGVFAAGVTLPKQYLKHHWRSLACLLGPVMIFGWFTSALFICVLIPKLNYLGALTIAAAVTPTDPILAAAVVGGKFAEKIPQHIRWLIIAESGANDGAAFPFLYIGIYLLTAHGNVGRAIKNWFLITWLYNIILSTSIGALLGFSTRKLMKLCERRRWIDRESMLAQYISLALLTIGIVTLLGSDDLLATFATGTAFAWDGYFQKATQDQEFSNIVDLLFNTAMFIYIGATIPFSEMNSVVTSVKVWRLVLITILILVLRRIPIVLALYKFIPDLANLREAIFIGWMGPMGVGAIFFATLTHLRLPQVSDVSMPTSQADIVSLAVRPIVYFVVLSSILVHGLSVPFMYMSKRVHTLTRTMSLSRTRSFARASPVDAPAWASHVQSLRPGEHVHINHDEESLQNEKKSDSDLLSDHREPESAHSPAKSSTSLPEAKQKEPNTESWIEGNDVITESRRADGDVKVSKDHIRPTSDRKRRSQEKVVGPDGFEDLTDDDAREPKSSKSMQKSKRSRSFRQSPQKRRREKIKNVQARQAINVHFA